MPYCSCYNKYKNKKVVFTSHKNSAQGYLNTIKNTFGEISIISAHHNTNKDNQLSHIYPNAVKKKKYIYKNELHIEPSAFSTRRNIAIYVNIPLTYSPWEPEINSEQAIDL